MASFFLLLSAQYTVRLQSAVSGWRCRFYRGAQIGPQSLTTRVQFSLGQTKRGIPPIP